MQRPQLSIKQILDWADRHRALTGQWPEAGSTGRVREAPGEHWQNIDACLRQGLRGLAAGRSLARLLAQRRGKRHRSDLPKHSIGQILQWADAYYARHGKWPKTKSGPVAGAKGETWSAINAALSSGSRGLPGGSSLAQLLSAKRGVAYKPRLSMRKILASADRQSKFTVPQILKWADTHRAQHGKWPHEESGPIAGANGETWRDVNRALKQGTRGLPGGSSLRKLIGERRGADKPVDHPRLSIQQILDWADAFHDRTGTWPVIASGAVGPTSEETWQKVDRGLRRGSHGLPGGMSLPKLLARRLGVPRHVRKRPLSVHEVLQLADAHHARTGKWPTILSGPIPEAPGETWGAISAALLIGKRNLPPRTTLAELLAQHGRKRNMQALPKYTIRQILQWADDYRARHGKWPRRDSGLIVNAPGETWCAVNVALSHGNRGLPGGSSLPRLLAAKRGAYNPLQQPPLSVPQILAWADAYHERTANWPVIDSGPVAPSSVETWDKIDKALRRGYRGLPGRQSLLKLLTQHRGVGRHVRKRRLDLDEILRWADAHGARTGKWPKVLTGPIPEAKGVSWQQVNTALLKGKRGLPGGMTIARLLAAKRGVRNIHALPKFSEAQILAWADAYHAQECKWPGSHSGRIAGAPGETWSSVEYALREGVRGMPGGSSLKKLLVATRGARRQPRKPGLSITQILAWADAFHGSTGNWPVIESGPVAPSSTETWYRIDKALRYGRRGLPGGMSLPRLLAQRRNVRRHVRKRPLSVDEILQWADAHHARTGNWPKSSSGPIPDAPGETWYTIAAALLTGKRNLPTRMTVAEILARHGRKRNIQNLPKYTIRQILQWADEYHARHGRWPRRYSGPIENAPGETWGAVNLALNMGGRGLQGGSSITRLLAAHRGASNPR